MRKLAPFMILSAGVMWGCMGAAVRTLSAIGLDSMQIVSIRAILTCVVMGIVLLCYKPNLFRIQWKDMWCFLGTGLCSVLFFNFCYFRAIQTVSLSVAAILLYTAPSFVMVMSLVLFKEQLSVPKVIALVLTFMGCVCVTGVFSDTIELTWIGILTGLGAGFGYALYSIFSRYALQRGYHTFTITFYTFLFASVGSLFFVSPKELLLKATASSTTILLCVGVAIIGTVLPYMTYTLGLSGVENGQASIMASIEPVTATILGIILFNEPLTFFGILGVCLVVLGLLVCNITPMEVVFTTGALWNFMPEKKRKEHLTYNRTVWERDNAIGFIENQEKMKSFYYGSYVKGFTRRMLPFDYVQKDLLASGNSCGVIAVYNALQALYSTKDIAVERSRNAFPELLYEFEKRGMVLNGNGGTAPRAIQGFFKKRNYKTIKLNKEQIAKLDETDAKGNRLEDILQKNYEVFILTAWNDAKHMSAGMHTMCITKEKDGFVIHNWNAKNNKPRPVLRDVIYSYSKAPICLIGIHKDE